ncbi:Xyloglucanase [bacterium HR08]|nr:Xyloglucanase [bacterium HR08]
MRSGKMRCGLGLVGALILASMSVSPPSRAEHPSLLRPAVCRGRLLRLEGQWLRAGAQGLFLSRDQGASWQRVGQGLAPDTVPLVLCAAPSDSRRVYLGTLRHGVYRSDDGGETWRSAHHGLPEASIGQILVHPEDADLVYVATDLYGIYRTRDGGESWEPANDGLPVPLAYRTFTPRLVMSPVDSSRLYVLIGAPLHSHRVGHAVYRSRDGGDRWERFADLPDETPVEDLRISRYDPRELEVVLDGKVLRIRDGEITEDARLWEPTEARQESRIAEALDFDAGEIAVLHDDGTLLHVFDLEKKTLQFTPIGSGGFAVALSDLLFEEELGQQLALRNDDALEIALPFRFPFYGRDRDRMFVNSNGSVSFGGRRLSPNPSTVSDLPMIAPLWTDLDPSTRGGVFLKATSERVVVTWNDVPEARRSNVNTFQIILERDGRFMLSFRRVEAQTGLTGVFNGNVLAQILFGRSVDFSDRLPLRGSTLPAVYELFDGVFRDDRIAQRFYQSHADDFDMLVVFGASSIPHDVTDGPFVYYKPIRNDVNGIGQSVGTFHGGPQAFGSQGRLQGFLNMNTLSRYPADPEQVFHNGVYSALTLLARETGRRWIAYVNFNDGGVESSALRSYANEWSFFLDTDASVMGGNNWVDNGDGTFESLEAALRYSPLDHYLMGLRSPRDIPNFFLIIPPDGYTRRTASSPPEVGAIVPGTPKMLTLQQIIQVEGQRSPAYPRAPTVFRQAFILVVPKGETVSVSDLEKLDRLRTEWEIFFRIATGGRARIFTRLKTPS